METKFSFFRHFLSQKSVPRVLGLFIIAVFTFSCKKNQPPADATADTFMKNGNSKMTASERSTTGDVVGKVVVGYQGWFGCTGDGSPVNKWSWGATRGAIPVAGAQTYEIYPEMREYPVTFQTGYANLGNGQPATLFSSWSSGIVDKHFQWMQQYHIDCAALQRFGSELSDPPYKALRDGITSRVRNAAETYGRKFYIMYDISGWTNFQTEMKADWTNTILGTMNLTSSPAYARQNGKPVVCVWGVGVSGGRPGNVTSWTDVITWLKAQGCYVIVGTTVDWRTDTANLAAYNAADMVSPWTVGAYRNVSGADGYVTKLAADVAYTDAHGQDYQPVVFPGFAWSWRPNERRNDFPRMHGDFMWQQFANIRNQGIPSAYVAMFDEYNEGTAIAKSAENSLGIPTDQYFLTMDADAVACSSDFYLRLTGDAAKMLKGTTPLVYTHPTPHINYLDYLDATTGWASGNSLSLSSSDKKEGNAALQSVGSGTNEFQKVFTAVNLGTSPSTGSIQFWYYVSDITKLGPANQIELGSGGTADVAEYNWNIGTLVNGWNLITKTFNTASITGGTPNLNAINWFRVYHAKTGSVTTKIDAIQILP